LVAGAAVLAGLAGAATVTRGQTGADTPCTTPADFTVVQTGVSGGTSYTVPSGQWTITSWRALGNGPAQEALVVFRPTGTPDQYTVVGSTSAKTLAAGLNTFNANIKVKGGDLIGLWVQQNSICAHATGSTADSLAAFFPTGVPSAGTTFDMFVFTGFRLNVSVELSTGGGSDGKSGSAASTPPFVPEPARIAICTAKPIQRSDGTVGTFADVLASEFPTTDQASPYFGAAPANYAQGIGLTCDNLPGYTDAGYKVNGDGVRAPAGLEASWPAPYEYYTKTG
jgi:hypothetical protein